MFILTEKPSVAKDIAAALGGFSAHKGYYSRNNDCIVYAVGHLLELFEPEEYDQNLKQWSLDNLPIIPDRMRYKPIPAVRDQLNIIRRCFAQYDSSDFILATDAEREGELIGALILEYAGFSHYSKARRFWVSEALTKEVVLKGLDNARPLIEYASYKNAGYARQHSDWLIGMNISRLLSIFTGTLLSFGRVQTAVLGAVFLRDKAIAEFVPSFYNLFQVSCSAFSLFLQDEKGNTKCAPNGAHLQAAVSRIKKGGTFTITGVTTEHKTEHPPQLFNITGLQKYCAEKFKYSPKKTLSIAQALYEKEKCLSYPRTPSTVLGDDNCALYREKFELLSKVYPDLASGCDASKITPDSKRLFNSAKLTDHHALIPLSPLPEAAAAEQWNVYSAVLNRFFTVIKAPHLYDAITVTAESNGFTLTGSGKTVTHQGWKAGEQDTDETDEAVSFPPISEGETYTITDTAVLEKQTSPKKHFTHASLLALMENPKGESGLHPGAKLIGLGTPATRADIIDTLLKREYICQSKQSLMITDKGRFLINTVVQIPALASFVSINTTTEWEMTLQHSPDQFVEDIKGFLRSTIPTVSITARWEGDAVGVCPVCKQGNILKGKKNWYCSAYKKGCTFVIWNTVCGASLSASDVQALLAGKKTKSKKMKSSTGKEFSAQLVLVNGKVEFVPFKK